MRTMLPENNSHNCKCGVWNHSIKEHQNGLPAHNVSRANVIGVIAKFLVMYRGYLQSLFHE